MNRPAHLCSPTLAALASPILLALAAAIAYGPALMASFTGDDWALLAIARHSTQPLAFYFQDHTFTYSYRPHGMVLWWIVTALAGTEPMTHYALNLALHILNSLLLWLLARRCGISTGLAMAAALVFAVHPIALSTAVWLSDRYDLLAVGGVLATLLMIEHFLRHQPRNLPDRMIQRLGLFLAALWAAGSKETAFVVAVAGSARLLMAWPVPWRKHILGVIVLVTPFMLALAARWIVLGGSGLEQLGDRAGSLSDYLRGVLYWLKQAPVALAGREASSLAWLRLLAAVIAMAALAVALLAIAARGSKEKFRSSLTLTGLLLALLPALVQSPITRLALASEEPLASITNHRFYYLTFAGFGLILMTLLDHFTAQRRYWRYSAIASLLLLTGGWLGVSQRIANDWQSATANPRRLAVNHAAATVAAQLQPPLDCKLYLLDASAESEDFPGFADALVKAQRPPGSPALNCIVMTEVPPWFAFTPRSDGMTLLPPPLAPRLPDNPLYRSRPVAGLIVHFPGGVSAETAAADPGARFFRYRSGVFEDVTDLIRTHPNMLFTGGTNE